MKKIKLVIVSGLALFIASCGNNGSDNTKNTEVLSPREQLLNEIKKYEAEMHRSTEINNVTAGLAIKAYVDYVELFPDDSLGADYLFKAGEISTAIQQYRQALAYYKKITEKYPKFEFSKESLFLQGYLLDNYLNDDAGAKIIYEQVIEKYPNSTYANDAKAAISNLGKTDEELIQEFKKKNSKNG